MRPHIPSSILLLSVDWPMSSGGRSTQKQHREHYSADKLIQLLDRYHLATTWAMSDPQVSAVPDLLQAQAVGHEVSLLGEMEWAAPSLARRRFAEELHHRLDGARQRGIDVRSYVHPVGQPLAHCDLVKKQQIDAVRMDDTRLPHDQTGQPYALRYGLWNVPANRTLPESHRWMWGRAGKSASKRLIRSVTMGQTAHVVIDGDHFAGTRFSDLRVLESILRNISDAREARRLDVETMSDFVARCRTAPPRVSACSILRKVA